LVVVSVVVIVFVLVNHQTRVALRSDDRLLGVRKGKSGPRFESEGTVGIVFDRDRTLVISEHTQVDGSSLFRAERSNEVLDFFHLTTVVVSVPLELSTFHVFFRHELFVHVVFHVLVALRHTGVDNTLVQALVLVPVVITVSFTVTVVLGVLATLLLGSLALGFVVGLQEGAHVNNVVSIAIVAASSISSRACVSGAKAETDKTLLEKTDIFLAIGFLVPLHEVVAPLELDGVVGDPLVGHHVFFLGTTSLGHEVASNLRVDFHGISSTDFRFGGDCSKGREKDGKSKLHGAIYWSTKLG
jgi:hypothetical protein